MKFTVALLLPVLATLAAAAPAAQPVQGEALDISTLGPVALAEVQEVTRRAIEGLTTVEKRDSNLEKRYSHCSGCNKQGSKVCTNCYSVGRYGYYCYTDAFRC